ncbi:hypothetical protein [Halomarina litorea]|uniref:hypothetical protein n=1 Tax=Halomarina litorea TaxID=2961595 RepID=UPI0020C41C0C|nr:hypothetical protein [Halomarina sp. BCD28]
MSASDSAGRTVDPDPDPHAEFDPDGAEPGPPTSLADLSTLDPWPLVVGAFVACAGLLMLGQPVLGRVALGGVRLPAFLLSTGVLSAGFALGALVYLRRGKRLVGIGHAVGAVGFGFLFVASGVGVVALWLGIAALVGGALFLAGESRRLD